MVATSPPPLPIPTGRSKLDARQKFVFYSGSEVLSEATTNKHRINPNSANNKLLLDSYIPLNLSKKV